MNTGKKILEDLESHCEEDLNCSRRLRFHIEETISKLINDQEALKGSIKNVLEGHKTYDPQIQKAIYSKK